jgi:coenzyme F420-reducing hydrogenase beta subunit
MRAGVITFHSANNYGATLQTWALQKVLKDYGIDAGVIHYHPDIIEQLYDPLFVERGLKRRLKKLKLFLFNRQSLVRYNKFQSFLKTNFKLLGDYRTYEELSKASLDLDVYITGSDQIWNPDHTGGFDPAYFLCFAEQGKRKLSYAASIGSDYINPKYKEDMRQALSTFTAVSVREGSIREEIQEIAEKPVRVVLDPTMLLVREDYEEIKVKSTRKEPYILVYMIEKNNQVITLANTLSISMGLPIIQRRNVPGFTNELEAFYTADAGEFLGLMEAAEYVITNSFHGTVFSILYEKPFVSMLHSDTGSRTEDLLKELGLESHLLYEMSDFTGVAQFKIDDPRLLRKKIGELRKTSLQFLVKNLGISDRYNKIKCPTKLTKEKCYGCGACMDSCKVGAIHMKEDREGFLYPVTNQSKCTSCGLCIRVCIRNNPNTVAYEASYPKAYTAYHTNMQRRQKSSSGAVFPALAQHAVEEQHGVVAGARYDENMKVIMDIAEHMEEVKAFFGSKYVKSDFTGIYSRIKNLLEEGRFVLYSGLPCECAGLRSYLRKDYDNLLICELICHAAPSPKVFGQYVEYMNRQHNARVTDVVFRSKERGWRIGDANMVITFDNGRVHTQHSVENMYFRAFLDEVIIRPSCTVCKYCYDKRAGDITLGDCWGIDRAAPELFDNKGVSLILVNNKKGEELWNRVSSQFILKENSIDEVFYKNHRKPSQDKKQRTTFFFKLDQEPIEDLLTKMKS